MAADIAPGLLRATEGRFGFVGWKRHDPALWDDLVAEARERRAAGLARLRAARARAGGRQLFVGYDNDPRAVRLAQANVKRAGLGGVVEVVRRELAALAPPAPAAAPTARPVPRRPATPPAGVRSPPGLVVTNPPYGERLESTTAEIVALYSTLGERLRAGFAGWRAAVLVGDRSLGHQLGMRAAKLNTLYNGALKVTLLRSRCPRRGRRRDGLRAGGASLLDGRQPTSAGEGCAGGTGREPFRRAAADIDDFANRLRKNARHWGRTMRRQNVTCFRVYDADLPDYAFAIDLYEEAEDGTGYRRRGPAEDGRRGARRAAARARTRPGVRRTARDRPGEGAGAPASGAARRSPRSSSSSRGTSTSRCAGDSAAARSTSVSRRRAASSRFARETCASSSTSPTSSTRGSSSTAASRARSSGDTARGARVLNLFAYTGAATVAAGRGGAASTTSVDLSRTYLDWARRNLELNKLKPSRNRLVQADALEWIGRPHDGSPDAPGGVRPRLPRPADLLELEEDGTGDLRCGARPRGSHPRGRAPPAASRRHAALRHQRAALPHGGRGPRLRRASTSTT